MKSFRRAVCLWAVSVLPACGGQEPAGAVEGIAGGQESALNTVESRGCAFELTAALRTGPVPPIYDLTLHRLESATCAWPAASLDVARSYGAGAVPSVALTAHEPGVAVGYVVKASPVGPYHTLGFVHVEPESMTVERSFGYRAPPTNLTSLSIEADGTTLTGHGTKSGAIFGETGSGDNFVVTFPDFFTSDSLPSLVAY